MTKEFAEAIGDIVSAFDWACQGDEFDEFSFLNAMDAVSDLLRAHALERDQVDDWTVERV